MQIINLIKFEKSHSMSLLTKSKIKYIQSLKDKKFREKYKTFVAEGDKMISDLLQVLDCELLLFTSNFSTEILEHSGVNIKEAIKVSKDEIERTSFLKNPQQALAIFNQPNYQLNNLDINSKLCLALDGIQDPGNLGTIIRLADWYGIEDIVCSEDTVDAYNPKVVQATMGALARVRVHYTDLEEWLRLNNTISKYGTFLDGEDMYNIEISPTGIIIMGNEGNGIRPNIHKYINKKLFIPNYPSERLTSESLNVAVATAIVCSEFRRRMR